MTKGLHRIWRFLTFRPCEICHHRTRCWRWHVEMFTCPTCGTEVSEFDGKRRDRVVNAIWDRGELVRVNLNGEPMEWDEARRAYVVGGDSDPA